MWGLGVDPGGQEQMLGAENNTLLRRTLRDSRKLSTKDTERQQEAPWPATDLGPCKDNNGTEGSRAGFSGSGSQVF